MAMHMIQKKKKKKTGIRAEFSLQKQNFISTVILIYVVKKVFIG